MDTITNAPNDSAVYSWAQEMPKFIGGDQKMMEYIMKNINFASSKDEITKSRITVQFTVDTNGELKDVIVPEGMGINKAMDDEVIRVVKTLPKWKPARRDGKAVAVRFRLPIIFHFQ